MQDEIDTLNEREAAEGNMGQVLLAAGEHVSMRLWRHEEPGDEPLVTTRPYETVGYVLEGVAELELEGATTRLSQGDSWVVPARAEHSYRILERFTAIEATSPATHDNAPAPEGY